MYSLMDSHQNPGSTSPMDNYGSGGCLYLAGVSGNISDVDTMRVTLMDPLTLQPVAESFGILQTDGYMNVIFEDSTLDGHSYYIRPNHRNSIETWSAVPVSMTDPVEYNFTDDIAKLMVTICDLGNGHFATGAVMWIRMVLSKVRITAWSKTIANCSCTDIMSRM